MTTNFIHPSPGSRMGKNQDSGSGINIPDPQHWEELYKDKDQIMNTAESKVETIKFTMADLVCMQTTQQ
jgi:hypothetical protein